MNKRKHRRIAGDNHPSRFGTRIARDNHSSRFGTRIAGDNHSSRFGTRITGDNHPSRFGDDSITDNDTSFDLAQDDAILEELQAHWDELNRRGRCPPTRGRLHPRHRLLPPHRTQDPPVGRTSSVQPLHPADVHHHCRHAASVTPGIVWAAGRRPDRHTVCCLALRP